MRTAPATLHFVSPIGSPCTTLYRALKPQVDARQWACVPPSRHVRPGDVVIVDLSDSHPAVDPRRLQPLLARATLCLIPGAASIRPHWLELAARPGVHVLGPRSGDGPTGDLRLAEVLRLVQGPSGEHVANLVLSVEPLLRFVQPLVEAVCLDPWKIR